MTETEGAVPAVTAEEAPAAESATEATSTPLTEERVLALLDERESAIRKEIEANYKTLRRGEAKSDTAHKRIERLEQELFEISLRGLEPQQIEIERLKRQSQRDAEVRSAPDPNAEVAAFQGWSSSVLEEEKLSPDDPVLKASFQRYADGWQSAADLRVALTRAIAQVHKEGAKTAKAEAAEREKKAREEERAKLRNETRQEAGKVDKGTPSATARASKSVLDMTPEEWEAFKATRGR